MPKEKKTKTNPNRIRPKTKTRLSVESQDRNGNRTSQLKTLFRKDVAARQKAVADEVADEDDQWEDDNAVTCDDVVDGSVPIDISHGGGEMADLEREEEARAFFLHFYCPNSVDCRRRRRDTRNRWDILQRCVNGFRQQMEAMTDAYMKFTASQGGRLEKEPPPVPPELVENAYTVMVVDIFIDVPMQSTDVYISSCLVGQGLMPCSPWKPKLAITMRVLEMYRLTHLRRPALGIQAWMKALSDLQGAAFKPYSAQQFTTCFDLYLGILEEVDNQVNKALQRDSKDWREGQLYFSMLATCDGNNSLKRVLRKDKGLTEDGVPLRGGCERPDPRAASAGGDYFISRPDVDRWVKEGLAEEVVLPDILDPEEASACEERWKNLSEELTSKMWGIFDETGIFLALCQHSFVLLVADMVRSGELAKYPLAIENVMMDAFGKDIGLGYDIGCGHAKTLKNSPLGPKAKEHNFSLLVGAFHGHAHNRRCQLKYLATYVEGMGIEDLEGCEHIFSKSNGLSRSVWYASVFHRKQTIRTYLAHVDTFDMYANLSNFSSSNTHHISYHQLEGTFLVNNYKQAVGILNTEKTVKYAMAQASVTEEMMEARLEEEKVYLDGLSVEPAEETDHMEYYQQLVNLADRRAVETVQTTEHRLSIEVRWTTEDPEWIQAAELVTMRRYRRAINMLEGLVVKRILELTKVNQSGLAYKLRDHIAKALKARSKAIRNALNRYNTAAAALDPPGRLLTWAEVVDYTFLSEFDILRNPDTTSSICAWTTPAARQLLDSYYKLKRAGEEIQRLNIEIRRFVTHMKDERTFLVQRESEIKAQDPVLAFFVRKYRNRWGRFDDVHSKRLQAMKDKLGPAFTGTLQPGIRVSPPVPPVPNPEEQGTVPSEPSMPPMPLPDVEPETTEMNIDEPAGGRMMRDLRTDGCWMMDPAMRMRDLMLKEKNCLQCWKG
ncbi:hypothetical protein K438DRAFT_2064966 [Mycena galopus ATCC 62051]|nr:hypothetical protein K438DRAFT_2064966 [Mycena galopus ATCC 62051]